MATRLHYELMKSPVARTGVGCLSVLCLLLTLLVGFTTIKLFMQAHVTSGWRETTARIEEVRIDETWSSGQTHYAPRIHYGFEYHGKKCTGNRIEPHERNFTSRGAAEESIAAFTVGAEVSVHVDPEDPSQSVLRPGARRMDYLLLGLPLVFLLFAYGFFQMLQRAKRERMRDDGED